MKKRIKDELIDELLSSCDDPAELLGSDGLLNALKKRRTKVAGLFPNTNSILRLVTAILMETSEEWETGKAYLNTIKDILENVKQSSILSQLERIYRRIGAPP